MITSTICHDEPKFYLNLVNFGIVVYVTHNVNAMGINIRHKKWQFGTEPTYPTLYTCSQDSTHIYNCIYIAFCIKNGVLNSYDTRVVTAKV